MKKQKLFGMKQTLGLAGFATMSGVAGEAFKETLPAGMKSPLSEAGTAAANFVGPMANISAAGMTLNMLKGFKKKK